MYPYHNQKSMVACALNIESDATCIAKLAGGEAGSTYRNNVFTEPCCKKVQHCSRAKHEETVGVLLIQIQWIQVHEFPIAYIPHMACEGVEITLQPKDCYRNCGRTCLCDKQLCGWFCNKVMQKKECQHHNMHAPSSLTVVVVLLSDVKIHHVCGWEAQCHLLICCGKMFHNPPPQVIK